MTAEEVEKLVERLTRSAFNREASARHEDYRHAKMLREAADALSTLVRERDEAIRQAADLYEALGKGLEVSPGALPSAVCPGRPESQHSAGGGELDPLARCARCGQRHIEHEYRGDTFVCCDGGGDFRLGATATPSTAGGEG